MESIAQYQFPRFVWNQGEKQLWNPVQKQPLKNRPEERVRLRVFDGLVDAGWSQNRISTEEKLDTPLKDRSFRADLICYDNKFQPNILVECKAEHIPISDKAAEQTARYNYSVGAQYLLLTNGVSDFWFEIENNQPVSPLDSPPDLLKPISVNHRPFEYWQKRGFAGKEASPALQQWLASALNTFWLDEPGTVRFLAFQNVPGDRVLDHYYKIIDVQNGTLGISFCNTASGQSRLIGVINREKGDPSMIEISLDKVANKDSSNAAIYRSDGKRAFNFLDYVSLDLTSFSKKPIQELPDTFSAIFNS